MLRFFKNRKQQKDIAMHAAGAIVVHKSPFDQLKVPSKTKELPQKFINKWIAPFYFERLMDNDKYEIKFLQITGDLNTEIVKQLLGFFDWRARITGAYFSSIMDYKVFDDFIGINLVKSEVCYAAEGYLTALASFNTDKSIDYLLKYLDYYLSKNDLWFDQGDAMATLIWLDNKNGTYLVKQNDYINKWDKFVVNKPNWKLDHYIDFFNRRMEKIERIKNTIKNGINK